MIKKGNRRILKTFALQSSGMFFPFNLKLYRNSGEERSMPASTVPLRIASKCLDAAAQQEIMQMASVRRLLTACARIGLGTFPEEVY